MRLVITEKQLKDLIRLHSENQELTEQGEGEGSPEAGTSSDGDKKTGASKWESGVTRGPANQIGVTKWSDVVGSKITRGKANPLSEQVLLSPPMIDPNAVNNAINPATDTPTKEYISFWGPKMTLPADGSVEIGIWDDKKPRALSFKNAYEDQDMPGYIFWPQQYIDPQTKKPYTKQELAPDEDWLKVKFPTGTIKWIETKKDKRLYTVRLTKPSNSNEWTVVPGYFYNNGKQYVPFNVKDYVHTSVTTDVYNWVKENWVIIGEVIVSVAAGILSGGASLIVQALIQAGVSIAFAGTVYLLSEKNSADTVGLVTGVMIGCLPFIPAATKIGIKGPLKSLAKYGDELALAKTNDEVLAIINKFDEAEKIMVTRCLKDIPKAEFEKVISNKLIQGFAKEVRNGKINITKIPGSQLKWWKELLVEGGGAIPIALGGFQYNSIQERKEAEQQLMDLIKNVPPDEKTPEDNGKANTTQPQPTSTTTPKNTNINPTDPFGLKK